MSGMKSANSPAAMFIASRESTPGMGPIPVATAG